MSDGPRVVSVGRDEAHRFAKPPAPVIRLLAGQGVDGDAHCGTSVQHRSRVRRSPGAANLRQVHLLHEELFAELAAAGFAVGPGDMGENVTTAGLALLALSTGTRLQLGAVAIVELTGLRNPCWQINRNIGEGAMAATLDRAPGGALIRKAGVMGIVVRGGEVRPGDAITLLPGPAIHVPLAPV